MKLRGLLWFGSLQLIRRVSGPEYSGVHFRVNQVM